jgi:hypothetical protein
MNNDAKIQNHKARKRTLGGKKNKERKRRENHKVEGEE